MADFPVGLYHVTYRENVRKIKHEGLLLSKNGKTWSDCKKLRPCIYLTSSVSYGISFCESNDEVPDSWLDEIIVLGVRTMDLDTRFLTRGDHSQIANDEGLAYMYFANIPPHLIQIARFNGGSHIVRFETLQDVSRLTRDYLAVE